MVDAVQDLALAHAGTPVGGMTLTVLLALAIARGRATRLLSLAAFFMRSEISRQRIVLPERFVEMYGAAMEAHNNVTLDHTWSSVVPALGAPALVHCRPCGAP